MINNLNPSIIMTTDEEARCLFMIAQLEELIAEVRAEHDEIRREHAEIEGQHSEIRREHAEIDVGIRQLQEQQNKLEKDISLWKKQGEEDLKFFQNLNAQFEVDFPHLKTQVCF